MSPTAAVRLYPRWWRQRYGEEMLALLEAGPRRARDAFDLARGALDAWLHPPTRSVIPPIAALAGGGLWTAIAAAVFTQPAQPDWPGYLIEVVPTALLAVACLLIATLGCALRAGDGAGRSMRVAAGIATVGFVAWLAALAATLAGGADGATLAAAQTVAMIGTTLVGVLLLRRGDETVGTLLVVGAVALLVPVAGSWLVFGAAWTAVGIAMAIDRRRREDDWIVS